jgi:hypothetical protein
MCEMCEANQAHYGLRSEGWQRWCATCATDGGGCAVEKAVYLKVPKAAASRQAAVLPDQLTSRHSQTAPRRSHHTHRPRPARLRRTGGGARPLAAWSGCVLSATR